MASKPKIGNIYYMVYIAFFMHLGLLAQQDPNYTFYGYNMNLVNPAYAGSSGNVDVSLALRSQWAGVDGAPESQSAIFGMPLGKNLGIGASVLNDRTFIERQVWLSVDFSYKLSLSESTDLYLGVKAGGNSYRANTEGLVTYGVGQDLALGSITGRFSPNIGAGAYLKHHRYYLSLSVPRILAPDRLEENGGEIYLGTDKQHLYLSGGYDFDLSESIGLRAMAMARYVEAAPLSLELTGILDLGARFGLGAGYRVGESIGGLFIFKASRSFHIGYAYESSAHSYVNGLSNATHEMLLSLKL